MFGCTHFIFLEATAFAVCTFYKVLMTPASDWAKKLFDEIQ